MLVVRAMSIFGGGRGTFGAFWDLKRCLSVTGARHRILFHSHGRRGTGESEKRFWKSFCMAGAIFRELGRRFERIEKSRFVKKCRHF